MKLFILGGLALLATSATLDCGMGSVVNNLGVCVQPTYIQGCYTYSSSTTCSTCSYSYTLSSDGKCQYSASQNQVCCASRNLASGACKQCANGLFLQNGVCKSKPVLGCLTQDSTGACVNCQGRFYLQAGKCVQGVWNCSQYADLGDVNICSKCKSGYSLMDQSCLKNKILGCKTQANGVCSKCYDPFVAKSVRCEIPNCQNYNEYGCTVCQCGYYLKADRTCSQISQGCIRYNRGACTDCMPDFTLKSGVCSIEGCAITNGLKCTSCQSGYVSSGSGCQLANCLISKDGNCQVCNKSYRYVDGKCVEVTGANTTPINLIQQ